MGSECNGVILCIITMIRTLSNWIWVSIFAPCHLNILILSTSFLNFILRIQCQEFSLEILEVRKIFTIQGKLWYGLSYEVLVVNIVERQISFCLIQDNSLKDRRVFNFIGAASTRYKELFIAYFGKKNRKYTHESKFRSYHRNVLIISLIEIRYMFKRDAQLLLMELTWMILSWLSQCNFKQHSWSSYWFRRSPAQRFPSPGNSYRWNCFCEINPDNLSGLWYCLFIL